MGIRIVTEHNIEIKKFGLLTFSLLTFDKFSNFKKILSSKITDKELFTQFLQYLLIKPKLTQTDLASLSDKVLIRIGKEIIKINHLDKKYSGTQESRKVSFYAKYRIYLEEECKAWQKSLEKHKIIFKGISENIRNYLDSTALSMIKDLQKRKDEITRFISLNSQLKENAIAFTNMHKNIVEQASNALRMRETLVREATNAFRLRETLSKEAMNAINMRETLIKEAMSKISNISAVRDAFVGIHNLYKTLSVPDKHHYQDLVMSSGFNQLYSASWQTINSFLQNAEITEYYSEDEIVEVRSMLEKIKDFINERDLLSKEKISLLGFFVTSFLLGIKTVIEGINSGKLDETWGSIAIVNLYFFFLYSIFKILKKEK